MRRALAALAAAGLCAIAAACAAGESVAPPRPAIWRVADADSTVWLFGSVHMLPQDLKWRSPALDAALAEAEIVYFETEIGEGAAAEVANIVAARGQAPPGTAPLSARLAPADAERLARVVARYRVDAARLERTAPWLAALNVSVAFVAAQGHALSAGVEQVLAPEAQRRGLEVRALETPRQQLGLLADLPETEQLRFLAASLRQIEEEAALVDEMDDAWARGDVARLEEVLMAQLGEAGPAVYDALVRKRNANWSEEIARFMTGEGDALVVVGAAHLLGPDSVQAMLAQKGLVAERQE